MKRYKQAMALAVLAGACLGAAAQTGKPSNNSGQRPDGPPPKPPAEAQAACKGKAEGEKTQFTGRGGRVIKGTCKMMGDVMAVMPEGGPPPPPPSSR